MNNSRRNIMKKIIGATALATTVGSIKNQLHAAETEQSNKLKGRINHSVCHWVFNPMSLDKLCVVSKEMGIQSVEILTVDTFPTLKKHNLVCGMVSGIGQGWGIEKAWNKIENHEGLTKFYHYLIDETAKAGFKNIICFSGNRDASITDQQGLENCAIGLKKLMPYAEKKGINIMIELLNSKVDHPNYMCDHTEWAVELCKKVDSPNFKIVYDIYHAQIMDGDIIATIKKYHQYFGHYHTGGVPGRHEIDSSQELNYPAIMEAIIETGYKGFVAQEFIPKRADKISSLKQGVMLCDV